ncbi:unnamed protein product, partial [Mesorhabditis spiculigera]
MSVIASVDRAYQRLRVEANPGVLYLHHPSGVTVMVLDPQNQPVTSKVVQVDFALGKSGAERGGQAVSGKGKRGALLLQKETKLCILRFEDGTEKVIRSGVKGNLLEVNDRLKTEPDLVRTSPENHGFLAIIGYGGGKRKLDAPGDVKLLPKQTKLIVRDFPVGKEGGPLTVAALANKYRAEFEETFETLRARAIKLQTDAPQLIQETQANVEPYKQEFITTVQATGDVTTPPGLVLTTLSWSTVLVLASTVASFVSGYVFAPVLGLAVGGAGALVLALGALPAYSYWSLNQDIAASASDVTIRFRLLTAAAVQGLLVGFILQNSYLSGAPIAPLLLGIAAAAYPFAAEKFGGNRQMLLGASVGSALGATLVLGLLSGYLTLPYLLLSGLYAGVTAVTLQYMYKNVTAETAPTYNYQLALLVSFAAARLVVHLIFGMGPDASLELALPFVLAVYSMPALLIAVVCLIVKWRPCYEFTGPLHLCRWYCMCCSRETLDELVAADRNLILSIDVESLASDTAPLRAKSARKNQSQRLELVRRDLLPKREPDTFDEEHSESTMEEEESMFY